MKNTLMTIIYVVLTFIFIFTMLNYYFMQDEPKQNATASKSPNSVQAQ